MLISDLYHKNPRVISHTASILEVMLELVKDEINGLIVVDGDTVKGVISLQDIAAATVPKQFQNNIHMAAAMYRRGFFSENAQAIKDKPVTKIMRKSFVSVSLHDNIMAITADFLKNDLYIVPVIEKEKLIGIVTRTEIKKALAYGMRLKGFEHMKNSDYAEDKE